MHILLIAVKYSKLKASHGARETSALQNLVDFLNYGLITDGFFILLIFYALQKFSGANL